ncbi:unnamed protein product [Linum tenue]|uniref:Adenylate isopentenyltransferase n=2 Tax=Linum tenue TaxID=586396 RepID=A0AAV0R605_9ROSI|nr:unnamed protein product [Linum tenue]
MDSSSPPPPALSLPRRQREKVLVIMGATGCGKSKLSVDLATSCGVEAEIINSDKMQVYKGLDIATNKITIPERKGVRHHLLGDLDPADGELTAAEFRDAAGAAVSDIASRGKLPVVVGGSNSFIYSLLVDRFHPGSDVFYGSGPGDRVSPQLRYDCCFLWIDVAFPVLCDYLCRRVDEMVETGMMEEMAEFYSSESWAGRVGLLKTIGVPELEWYYKMGNFESNKNNRKMIVNGGDEEGGGGWDTVRRSVYEDAVRKIKENTCRLAERQVGKIVRLKSGGWDLHRVDATDVFRERLRAADEAAAEAAAEEEEMEVVMAAAAECGSGGARRKSRKKRRRQWAEVWEKEVMDPSVKIVKRFLEEE